MVRAFSIYPFRKSPMRDMLGRRSAFGSTVFIIQNIALVGLIQNIGKWGFVNIQRKNIIGQGLYKRLSARWRALGLYEAAKGSGVYI